jgi:4-hydroxybenzoate polyprenyltransferase
VPAGIFEQRGRILGAGGRITGQFVVETAVVEAGSSMGIAGSYLKLARPKQWTKNGFVLAGVVFGGEALSASSVISALLAFVAFCALSGAVYAGNDVLDVEEDRKHPLKRHRPVASGVISPRSAIVFAIVLAAAGLALGFFVNPGVGLAGVAYLALQVLYTSLLKHTAILDVMSISTGFVIRALAGVAAVEVRISPWLIVCTGLLTLFLGFSKRRHELAALGERAVAHRKNLRDYSVPMLDEMMNIMISATIIAYTLYTFFEYENVYMMASIPFVIYGVFRYMLLVHRDGGGNPDTLLLRDRPLQITLLLWLAVVMTVLYGLP